MPQTALSQQHSNSGSRQRGGNKGWRVDEARERGTHSSPSLLILFYGCSLSDLHLRLSGNLTLMSLPAPWPRGAISTCIFCRTAERVSYFNSLEQSIVTDFQAPVSCNTPPNTLVGGEVKRWIVTLLINIHYHGCQLAHVVSDNTPSNANGWRFLEQLILLSLYISHTHTPQPSPWIKLFEGKCLLTLTESNKFLLAHSRQHLQERRRRRHKEKNTDASIHWPRVYIPFQSTSK